MKSNNLKTNTLKIGLLATLLLVLWGVSRADLPVPGEHVYTGTKNYSSADIVRAISPDSQSIEVLRTKNGEVATYNVSSIKQITTRSYQPLALTDIHIGDNIISQGIEKNGETFIRRLIVMVESLSLGTSTVATSTVSEGDTNASSTASTTLIISDNATSTDTVATTTPSTATTTEPVSTSTDPVVPPTEPVPLAEPTPSLDPVTPPIEP